MTSRSRMGVLGRTDGNIRELLALTSQRNRRSDLGQFQSTYGFRLGLQLSCADGVSLDFPWGGLASCLHVGKLREKLGLNLKSFRPRPPTSSTDCDCEGKY